MQCCCTLSIITYDVKFLADVNLRSRSQYAIPAKDDIVAENWAKN